MSEVVLRPDLHSGLVQEAEKQRRDVNDLVNEAVQGYLRQREVEKIGREQAAYERMHADLKSTCLGKWVAVHEGQVVDSDADDVALHQRILAGYGNAAILITRVGGAPVREIRIRTPRPGRPGR